MIKHIHDKKIIILSGEGFVNKEIASLIGKSEHYVENRISWMCRKFECRNKTHLVRMFTLNGFTGNHCP